MSMVHPAERPSASRYFLGAAFLCPESVARVSELPFCSTLVESVLGPMVSFPGMRF